MVDDNELARYGTFAFPSITAGIAALAAEQ
jgi:hypothetical protein